MIDDRFISFQEIESETKEIGDQGAHLALKLSLISQKINYIFLKIKACPSVEAAEDYFILLEKLQECLATLEYKHEIGIPDRLYRFVEEFDNIDHYKVYLFDQIKSGKYIF